MDNTFTKKSIETTRQIFTPIIETNNSDRGIKLGLNHVVKYLKIRGHLTFLFFFLLLFFFFFFFSISNKRFIKKA
jgi:hypothetical protein